MSDITLSASVRSNLLSLQNTASLLDTTQTRLATGNKVNSALDNPTNYFTASSLNSRASDLGNLLDGVSNAVQTIQAANDGITSITKLVESAQATANQAQQLQEGVTQTTAGTATAASAATTTNVSSTGAVNTLAGGTYTAVNFSGGGAQISFDLNIGGTTRNITVAGADVANGAAVTNTTLITALNTKINTAFGTTGVNYAVDNSGKIDINGGAVNTSVVVSNFAAAGGATGSGLANGTGTGGSAAAALNFTVTTDGGTAQNVSISKANVDAYNTAKGTSLVASALSGADVASLINYQTNSTVASTDTNGKLKFTSSTAGTSSSVAVSTVTAVGSASNTTGITAALSGNGTSTSVANPARAAFISQYNGLLDQIDQLTADAGYNGNNLLSGTSSQLKVLFNETGTSSLTVNGKDTSASGLGLDKLTAGTEFDTNASITGILAKLKTATDTLRSDASSFGSNLSIVQTRQDFTKNLINTLQTRQSLSTKALSLASQSDQNVLRLLQ